MRTYATDYRQKLTTPDKAVAGLDNGSTIVHGLTTAEPPALLAAIADRARAGELNDLKIYSFNPQKHVAETVFAPDLCDCIQAYSWFVSGSDRPKVKVGLNYYVLAVQRHGRPARFCTRRVPGAWR